MPICSNWPALTSLLKLTKTTSVDMMHRGMRRTTGRTSEVGWTAMQIVFCPQHKWIKTDRLRR
jgi:hypothetical protein